MSVKVITIGIVQTKSKYDTAYVGNVPVIKRGFKLLEQDVQSPLFSAS